MEWKKGDGTEKYQTTIYISENSHCSDNLDLSRLGSFPYEHHVDFVETARKRDWSVISCLVSITFLVDDGDFCVVRFSGQLFVRQPLVDSLEK